MVHCSYLDNFQSLVCYIFNKIGPGVHWGENRSKIISVTYANGSNSNLLPLVLVGAIIKTALIVNGRNNKSLLLLVVNGNVNNPSFIGGQWQQYSTPSFIGCQ